MIWSLSGLGIDILHCPRLLFLGMSLMKWVFSWWVVDIQASWGQVEGGGGIWIVSLQEQFDMEDTEEPGARDRKEGDARDWSEVDIVEVDTGEWTEFDTSECDAPDWTEFDTREYDAQNWRELVVENAAALAYFVVDWNVS